MGMAQQVSRFRFSSSTLPSSENNHLAKLPLQPTRHSVFSLTMVISTCLGSVFTLLTGLMFAKSPSSLRSLTMGLE